MREKHPEKVLLCLRDREHDYKTDVELGADMFVSELKTGLLRLLKRWESACYGSCTSLTLYYNGRQLKDNETPASLGIWDGSELQFHAGGV